MRKENKYCYGWRLYTNYGYGWENEGGFYDNKEYKYSDVKRDAQEYKIAGASTRITESRMLNPYYNK